MRLTLTLTHEFPFLFGGTFIEGEKRLRITDLTDAFPFLFGGTFIEGP